MYYHLFKKCLRYRWEKIGNVVLIDGQKLAELVIEYNVGVTEVARPNRRKGMVRRIKYFRPTLMIKRSDVPVIFLDTFMWFKILKELPEIENLLKKCCKNKKILVIITNLIKGELQQRKIFEQVQEICEDSFKIIPSGYISANQIIHLMIAYYEDIKEVCLSWDISISKVPILAPLQVNLKDIAENVANELNKMKSDLRDKRRFISALVHIERELWKENLKTYWELISQKQKPGKNYEEFFYSDYFVDLPYIVLKSYLLGYILHERDLTIQDVVDVFTISEVVPYTALSVLDKDQYNRLLQLKEDYSRLFHKLFEYVHLISFHHVSPNPIESLKLFLEWAYKETN